VQLLVVVAVLVVLALAGTLAVTLRRLLTQRRRAQAGAEALAAHNQVEHERRLKSLEMITLATLAGDCELSEGCLRVRALLQFYPGLRAEPEFEPIERLHGAIRHFDVGDARREQSPDVLARQDRERHAIEGGHRSAVLASFRVLRERVEELRGSAFDVDVARGAD
jgi:hypothetical protein